MKRLHTPIKLAAIFYTDGQVVPFSFIFQNKKYHVTLVRRTWETRNIDHGAITNYLIQAVGPEREERLCEVAFYRYEMKWALVKF